MNKESHLIGLKADLLKPLIGHVNLVWMRFKNEVPEWPQNKTYLVRKHAALVLTLMEQFQKNPPSAPQNEMRVCVCVHFLPICTAASKHSIAVVTTALSLGASIGHRVSTWPLPKVLKDQKTSCSIDGLERLSQVVDSCALRIIKRAFYTQKSDDATQCFHAQKNTAKQLKSPFFLGQTVQISSNHHNVFSREMCKNL